MGVSKCHIWFPIVYYISLVLGDDGQYHLMMFKHNAIMISFKRSNIIYVGIILASLSLINWDSKINYIDIDININIYIIMYIYIYTLYMCLFST